MRTFVMKTTGTGHNFSITPCIQLAVGQVPMDVPKMLCTGDAGRITLISLDLAKLPPA